MYQPEYLEDDGLVTPDVGPWTIEKHGLISLYARLFSTGMKNKWPSRVYLDLFAGSGRGRIKTTGKIIPGSPLLALGVADPFTDYIFCEADPECFEALKKRVPPVAPANASIAFVAGDVNAKVEEVRRAIPPYGRRVDLLPRRSVQNRESRLRRDQAAR